MSEHSEGRAILVTRESCASHQSGRRDASGTSSPSRNFRSGLEGARDSTRTAVSTRQDGPSSVGPCPGPGPDVQPFSVARGLHRSGDVDRSRPGPPLPSPPFGPGAAKDDPGPPCGDGGGAGSDATAGGRDGRRVSRPRGARRAGRGRPLSFSRVVYSFTVRPSDRGP